MLQKLGLFVKVQQEPASVRITRLRVTRPSTLWAAVTGGDIAWENGPSVGTRWNGGSVLVTQRMVYVHKYFQCLFSNTTPYVYTYIRHPVLNKDREQAFYAKLVSK